MNEPSTNNSTKSQPDAGAPDTRVSEECEQDADNVVAFPVKSKRERPGKTGVDTA